MQTLEGDRHPWRPGSATWVVLQPMSLETELKISSWVDAIADGIETWLEAFDAVAEAWGFVHTGPCTCQRGASGHWPRCGYVREGW